jgi:hypothetical protein
VQRSRGTGGEKVNAQEQPYGLLLFSGKYFVRKQQHEEERIYSWRARIS